MSLIGGSFINPKLTVRHSSLGGGRGLFAARSIKKGEILTISGGVIIPRHEMNRIPATVRNICFFAGSGYYMCPRSFKKISPDFYINHSCSPNAATSENILEIIALRDIRAGEEITYDYRTDYNSLEQRYRAWRRFKCRCGSPNCVKVITA